jgi:hypothetical protein
MKPLNLDNRPCSPISSNCVIWQGPDIPCIKLCAGDTISDVVYKLATELCTIMDTLKITNYDLSCFNLTACPPENFQELIQFLINRICELDGTPTDTTRTTSTCPDCVVNVASCFVQGTQTTMQLVDYVRMIGEKICSIVSQITELQNQIDSLDIRVTALEDAVPPTYTLPSISTNCLQANMTGNPVSATIDLVLNALLNNPTNGYCALLDSTGSPAEISAAVLSQCITDLDQPLAALPTVTTFSAYYAGTWVQSGDLNTAADAINNLWIALCDMRTYVTNLSQPVVEGGEGITVTSAVVSGVTTYTVTNDYLETFVAYLSIRSTYQPLSGVIPSVLPSSVKGVQEGQVISKYTSVLANSNLVSAPLGVGNYVLNGSLPTISFGTFDNDIGLFTITEDGTYSINATIHLKPNDSITEFWSGTTTYSTPPTVDELKDNFNAIGSFYIGVHPNNNTDVYIADSQVLVPSLDRNVEISAIKDVYVSAGSTLRVKVLNTTNRNYDGRLYGGADFISFSITKLRNGI